MSNPILKQPDSICILRLSAIGDVTHIVPIIRTLQATWPNCHLTWIIGQTEARLVSDIEGVEFIIFNKTEGLNAFKKLRTILKNRHFEVLLHMQAAFRASLISLFINSPLKIGFDHSRAINGQWLFTNRKIEAKSNQHVLDGFFGFLEAMGIQKRVMQWDIPIPAAAQTFADSIIEKNKPILIVNPSTSSRKQNWRNWTAENYAAIADYAVKQHSMQIILTGGPADNEKEMATAIAEKMQSPVTNLVGKTILKELLAVLNRATVVISPDTGPAHMASACAKPVIGLYAGSNPDRTGPYRHRECIVNKYAEALQHYRRKTPEQVSWGTRIRHPGVMQLITVNDVKVKLDQYFQ